jgi:citrate lyase beta subunit
MRWFERNRLELTLAVVDGESEELSDALLAALSASADGVLIRRCAGLAGLERVETALRLAEARLGIIDGATSVVASMADTARAVLAMQTPIIASPRLIGLTWDRARLQASLGVADPSPLLDQARLQLLFAAAAAGLPAFDCDMGDDVKAAEDARALGFAGVCIG